MTKRCAVYTRKSSEEGLGQDFNSLQAQREACEAFIKSQQSEGWRLVRDHYDDGGISGATMERPALKQLLADIEAGRVDVVVVYKVDRLTRSLADFAKMIELFDSRGVSFVAVTQQFNTTSSMGRLTLNVLLSFAQFEREVTGERIRDKIAASKRKGMWMGGPVPLGYEVKDRKLVINNAKARIVREIYSRYVANGNVRSLKEDLDRQGSKSFSRGNLYLILSNPIYVGEIAHKGQRYPGLHEPIIEKSVWEAAQQKLANNTVSAGPRKTEPSPLVGKLFDESGECLAPSHSLKDGRRYRYYISRRLTKGKAETGWRLPAKEIEQVVANAAATLLRDSRGVAKALADSEINVGISDALRAARDVATRLENAPGETFANAVERADLDADRIQITVNVSVGDVRFKVSGVSPLGLKRRGVELRMVVPGQSAGREPDQALMKALSRGHRWMKEVEQGTTIAELARKEGIDIRDVRRALPLAFLAPSIVEAIFDGTQPPGLTARQLLRRTKLDPDWQKQRIALGFA